MLARSTLIVLIGVIGLTLAGIVQSQDEPIKKDTTTFMKRKLDASRDVVAGLSTENFELMRKSAQNLMLLSHEADWKVITTPDYLRMSNEFRRSAERLRENAKDENLDGSTLAYFEVTLSCVRCHKYIRNQRR